MNDALQAKALETVEALKQQGFMLALAESCTGGLIAASITDIAGASSIFGYGFITYSNEAKNELLNVDMACINKYGAVSEAVASAMAEGAREKAAADIALAITGIAGPGGGSIAKPVGLVFTAVTIKSRKAQEKPKTHVQCHHFQGSRATIRYQSTMAAFHHILSTLPHASQ